jgi:DNA-binding GntR family transcriptional regulator
VTSRETSKAAPRYRALADELTEEIRRGVYPPGALLPTEAELCLRFAAGRHTVRDALRIISDQGLIRRRAGLGSVVMASDPPAHFQHSVTSLAEWLRYPTETWRETCRTGEITADRDLAALLKCERGKRWFRISSIRRGAGIATPLAWTDIYVLPAYAGVEKRPDHGHTPVHSQIAKMFGETIERAELDIFVSRIAAEHAESLEVEAGSPALSVIRRYFGERSGLFEVTVTTHPEGRYTYSMELSRTSPRG